MKEQLLIIAVELAQKKGLSEVTRNGVARAAKVSSGSVSYHFKDARKLLSAVVAEGIRLQHLRIVGEALAMKHPLALKAPDDLRRNAALYLAAGSK